MPTFQMTGFEQFGQKFKDRIKTMVDVTNERSKGVAEGVRDLAKEYCPEREGDLADSIQVVESESGLKQGRNELGQFSSEAIITYTVKAGGPNLPHTLAVHENPSKHDPPSWKGKTVNFTKGGSQFLARAFRDYEREMRTRLGKKIFGMILMGFLGCFGAYCQENEGENGNNGQEIKEIRSENQENQAQNTKNQPKIGQIEPKEAVKIDENEPKNSELEAEIEPKSGENEPEIDSKSAENEQNRGIFAAVWCKVVSNKEENKPITTPVEDPKEPEETDSEEDNSNGGFKGCDAGFAASIINFNRLHWVAVIGTSSVGTGLAWSIARGKGRPMAVALGVVANYDSKGIYADTLALTLGATVSLRGGVE